MRRQFPRPSTATPAVLRSSAPLFWLACAVLYATLALLYAPSISLGTRLLDDQSQLAFVAHRSLLELLGFDHFGHLRPVKNLLFWCVQASGNEHLAAWRLGILACFIGSAGLLQRVATRLFESRWLGLGVAAAWSLNPSVASVVCWLSAGNIAIALLGILGYFGWGERSLARPQAQAWRSGLLAHLALGLAIASYEVAVVAPAVLWLYRQLCARSRPARPTMQPLRFFAGSAACVAAYLMARALGPEQPGYRLSSQPAWALSVGAARHIVEHAAIWLAPWNRFGVLLSERPLDHLWASVACWPLLLACALIAWRLRSRQPRISYGLGWFAIFMLPVSNLIPVGNTALAPYYLYVPSIGLCIVLIELTSIAARALASSQSAHRGAFAIGTCLALIAAWTPETARIIGVWQSDERLYAETLANHPDQLEALINLGALDVSLGHYPQAEALLERAQRIAPEEPTLVRDWIDLYIATGRLEAALALLKTSFASDQPELMAKRAQLLDRLGRYSEAVPVYEEVFRHPGDPGRRYDAGYELIVDYLRTQRRPEAERMVDELSREYPEHANRELALARRLLGK